MWRSWANIMREVWHRDTVYMCNLSTSVEAAPPMIFSALNGPSGCLWYDEGTTKLILEYLTSMETYDMHDSNSTSYIQWAQNVMQCLGVLDCWNAVYHSFPMIWDTINRNQFWWNEDYKCTKTRCINIDVQTAQLLNHSTQDLLVPPWDLW